MTLLNPYSPSAILNRLIGPRITNLVNHSNPVLAAMTKEAKAVDTIRWNLKTSYGVPSTGTIADGADYVVPAGLGSTYENASLDWAWYITYASVNKQTAARLAEGQPLEFARLVYSALEDKAKELSNTIANDLFAQAASVPGFVTLPQIVADNNIYAGIDRNIAANREFRSVVVDAAANGISTNLLNRVNVQYFNANREQALNTGRFVGVTSMEILSRYQRLFTNIDIASLGTAHFVNRNTENALAKFEQTMPSYMSTPLMPTGEYSTPSTDTANTNRIYFLDMSAFKLLYLPQMFTGLPTTSDVSGVAAAGRPPEGIQVYIEQLPNKGEKVDFAIKCAIQTQCIDPKRSGMVLKNVSIV